MVAPFCQYPCLSEVLIIKYLQKNMRVHGREREHLPHFRPLITPTQGSFY